MEESQEDFEDSFLQEVTRAEQLPRVPLPGERMGGADGRRFEVLEELGAGAMGHVFRAWDVELQRVVALKFLLRRQSPEEGLPLLRYEARAVARLGHENIVRLFDVAEWTGASWEPRIPFLVMEYLEGESLADVLQRGKPGLRRTLALMGAVAAGLAHAHAHHIVHRDLKPGNVLLTPTGEVKLLDFGLAWLMASTTVPPLPHLPTAGTPPYMAPEQWRGEEQDARTDLWAAGVMLYELLTGELPYQASSLAHLRAQVLAPEPVPSVRERCPELPEAVVRLVAELLVKEPTQRLSSAAELRERLHRLEEALGPWHAPAAPMAAQRRQVTLVSCRLVGSGGLLASMDLEDASELQARFQRFCSEVLQRHRGFLTLSVGDEVLACFGYPLAREEDAERAVRAGLQVVEDWGGALPHLGPLGLAVQVGIHTDAVVFGAVPTEPPGRMPALQGVAPRVASGLARQAAPGAVVLSGSTWALVRGAFEAECLGPRRFEDVEVDVCRVQGARKARFRFERALAVGGLTPLVGRERELERLREAWARARAGQGGFLLLSGEAGIGKSRLIQELCEQVPLASSTLLRGQCWSSFSSSAFHPIIALLGKQVPRALVPTLQGEPLSMLSSLEQQAERKQKVLGTLVEQLLEMAEERPVLLVIEDLHWADPSTLELLGLLSALVAETRLLVLLSARPEFQPGWGRGAGVHRLALERLSEASTAVLVREVVGGRRLPEETVRQLVARTDGIPLFVEELTRMVLERGPAAHLPSIPITLQELLLARLDGLPARQKALAQLCAVVGRGFRQALLSRLLAWDADSLRQALAGLLSVGLLRRQQEEAGDAYQFRHALIQEAAYQSLPRSARRQHHQRVAQTLVEHFPETAEQQPEVLAHHYVEAGAPEQAIHYSVRAAENAILQSGRLEAITQLKGALSLLRGLPDSQALLHEEMRLLNALGIFLMESQGYGSPEVDQTYTRALELFRQKGESLPQLELLWLGLGSYFTLGGKFALAEDLAAQLLALGRRRQDAVLLSHARRMRAWIRFYRGESASAVKDFEQLRQRAGSPEEARSSFTEKLWVYERVDDQVVLCLLYMVSGQLQKAAREERELRRILQELSRATTLAYGLLVLAMTCQLRRDARGVLRWSERAAPVAQEPQLHPLQAIAQGLHGWALVEVGQVSSGLESLRSSCAMLERLSARAFLPYFLGMLGEACLGVGRLQEGRVAVREGLRLAEETGARLYEAELQRLRGALVWRAGKVESARRSFLRAVAVARRQHALLFELRATVSLGHLLRALGRPRGVRRRLERLVGRFEPGVELVDLQEARALLSAFAGTESPPPSPTSHPG